MRERQERLTELFRRHADDIHTYASWRVGRQDAPDVVGEVFLAAWRSLDRIRAGEERGWLFGAARNIVLARRRHGAASAALGRRLVTLAVEESERDGLADDVARRDHICRALDALGERDREVLITATWFDLRPAEAARVLDISRPTYLVRLHRARNRFRSAYQQVTEAEDHPSAVRNPLAA